MEARCQPFHLTRGTSSAPSCPNLGLEASGTASLPEHTLGSGPQVRSALQLHRDARLGAERLGPGKRGCAEVATAKGAGHGAG